jgi:hypothetical protein
MTTNATTQQIRHQAGAFILTLNPQPHGYSVHVEHASTGTQIDALTTTWPTFEQAIACMRNAYRHFASGGTIADGACGGVVLVRPRTETPADTVILTPPAKGTATKITDPGLKAVDTALYNGGWIGRGDHEGQAPEPVLKALAKRNHLTLTYATHGRRKVTTGGSVTRAGLIAWVRATFPARTAYMLAA